MVRYCWSLVVLSCSASAQEVSEVQIAGKPAEWPHELVRPVVGGVSRDRERVADDHRAG